jgi:hypothetical protein
MATTPKRLVSGSQLTTSAATYYTAATSTKTRISAFTATNTSAGAVTMTVHLVASGGSASASNKVADVVSLAANETKAIVGAIGHVIEAGGTIQALASANTSITIVVSGYEIV